MPHATSPFRMLLTAAVCASVVLIAGCGESLPKEAAMGEPLPVTEPAVETSDEAAQEIEPLPVQEPAITPIEPTPSVTLSDYTPPFQNRNNLFQPPTQGPRHGRATENDKNSSVVLMGFANVGVPKVVLAIDGIVSPLAGGESYSGVEVISIHAPSSVVLQRGRSRWTASIE